jgi:mRNA interferase RelE/StbE
MIFYEKDVKKSIRKGLIPKGVFRRFNNAFVALDVTGDLGLFDVKKLKSSEKRTYYRLRRGKYRAVFYIEKRNYYVISIATREEVYHKWE